MFLNSPILIISCHRLYGFAGDLWLRFILYVGILVFLFGCKIFDKSLKFLVAILSELSVSDNSTDFTQCQDSGAAISIFQLDSQMDDREYHPIPKLPTSTLPFSRLFLSVSILLAHSCQLYNPISPNWSRRPLEN